MIKPMLAYKVDKKPVDWSGKVFVQPKLDGVRCIFTKDGFVVYLLKTVRFHVLANSLKMLLILKKILKTFLMTTLTQCLTVSCIITI